MTEELSRTIIQDQKVYFGEAEFTELIRTLTRVYRFRSGNQTPEAIVMPDVVEVDGVKVEFPEAKPTPELVDVEEEIEARDRKFREEYPEEPEEPRAMPASEVKTCPECGTTYSLEDFGEGEICIFCLKEANNV